MVWRSSPRWFLLTSSTLTILAFIPLAFIFTIKLLVDQLTISTGQGPTSVNELMPTFGLIALIITIQVMFNAISRFIQYGHQQVLTDFIYKQLHSKAIEVDLEYYEHPKYRDTLHMAQKNAHVRPGRILNGLINLSLNLFSLAIMMVLLILFDWRVIVFLALLSIPLILVRLYFASDYYSWERKATAKERMAAYLNELLNTELYAKDIRLFSLGNLFREKFDQLRTQLRLEKIKIIRNRAMAEFSSEIFIVIGVVGILAFMSYEAINERITFGDMVMYLAALQRAWTHLGKVLIGMSELYEDNLFLNEIFSFLDLKPRISNPTNPKIIPVLQKGIEFKQVSFKYPTSDKFNVSNLSLSIEPGQHVAIVGHNGSGKTTLVKLLSRLYDVTEGSIQVDGIDIRDFEVKQWRHQLGVLLQDYSRFQQTARENIHYGDISLPSSSDRVEEAAQRSGADKIIEQMPLGYDTLLGHRFEKGYELSVGQWQKIALTRLFVRDAQIMILDEPTSSMDPKAEEEVLRKFDELCKEKTTIIISHRLSTIKMADKIFVMDKGTLAEQGTHQELMKLGGIYAGMYTAQAKRYYQS